MPSPVDSKNIEPALEACKKAKVAVFVVDTEVQDRANVVSVIQSDNYRAGELVAEDMMKRLTKGANIVLFIPLQCAIYPGKKKGIFR